MSWMWLGGGSQHLQSVCEGLRLLPGPCPTLQLPLLLCSLAGCLSFLPLIWAWGTSCTSVTMGLWRDISQLNLPSRDFTERFVKHRWGLLLAAALLVLQASGSLRPSQAPPSAAYCLFSRRPLGNPRKEQPLSLQLPSLTLFPPDPSALSVNDPALVKWHCLPQEHVPAVEGVVLRCARGREHSESTAWRQAQSMWEQCRAAGLLCSTGALRKHCKLFSGAESWTTDQDSDLALPRQIFRHRLGFGLVSTHQRLQGRKKIVWAICSHL